MSRAALSLAAGLALAFPSLAADPPQHFFDEATMRHLRLRAGEFGTTDVEIRFASDPGSSSRWLGVGQKNDRVLTFARLANEGEDRGSFFVANLSESKVEIEFKPGQKDPQDPGILGTYRRASEAKRLQLAKKEFQAANERLVNSLKASGKSRAGAERAAITLWKDQWPALRQRWLTITYLNPPSLLAAANGPAAGAAPGQTAHEKDAEYWFKLADATARGYYFVETVPDQRASLGWDGEYDDFAGGHASLRQQKDGRLRMSLSFARTEDVQADPIEAVATPEKQTRGKDGELQAEFQYAESESAPKAKITFTKYGRYLLVKTEGAERYAGKGWFDGIFRGSPVPEGGQ